MGVFTRAIGLAGCLFTLSQGQILTLGQGSILAAPGTGQAGPSDNLGKAISPRLATGAKGPVPTNDWWSSLVFRRDESLPFGKPLYAWPLTFLAFSGGWSLGQPDSHPSLGTEYHFGHVGALKAGLEGLAASEVQVVKWSDWTVTARLEDGSRSLDATMGHGMPFAYFTSRGADARIECLTDPVVWSGEATDAVGISVAGNHYGIFAPPGSSWIRSGKVFRSDLGGRGHWSVAVLPDASPGTLERFRQVAFAFPVDTRVAWTVDPTSGRVVSRYTVTTVPLEGTESGTLMALFRHQWMRSGNVNTLWTYPSPRGTMRVVDGNEFATSEPIPALLPFLPPPAEADRPALGRELKASAAGKLLDPSGDTYWAGKGLWKAASLVDLADQLGEIQLRDSLLSAIKAELQDWFSAAGTGGVKSRKVFAYHPRWGSLVGYPASYGSDGELNDHHFHWGYFLQAAAVVARFDKNWSKSWGGVVDELVADANNPRRADPRYPFLRHFDIFEGHSWASGHAYFDAGNNHESSSESMHFDAGLALWGMASGNDSLRDAGLFLAATEMRAVEQDWWDVDREVFPAGFAHKAVGMVWGNGGAHATWFSGEPECVHGINTLPFSPASILWTRRPDRVALELSEMREEKVGGALTTWRDVMMAYRAISEPSQAWTEFDNWNGSGAEDGLSRAWYRSWISLLRDQGGLDTAVASDHLASLVLAKGGVRTYLAWNPGVQPIQVKFGDGYVLDVPGGVLGTGRRSTSLDRSGSKVGPAEVGVRRCFGADAVHRLGKLPVEIRKATGILVYRGEARAASLPGEGVYLVRILSALSPGGGV